MPGANDADAAVGQADQDSAGVGRRGPGRIAIAKKRRGLDLKDRPGANGVRGAAGHQGGDRKPRLKRFARRSHGRRLPGEQGVVQYAHAVPPSWNAGAIAVFVQRAYFSAWRMVCEVPSAKSLGMRAFPCGLVVGGVSVRSFFADTRALGA